MSANQSEQLILGLIIMAGPVVALIIFLVHTRRWRTVPDGGEQTEGRIISKRQKAGGEGSTQYLAIVEYVDHNLVTVSKEFSIGRSAHKELGVGTSVPVIFDPRKPKRARLGPDDRLPSVLQDWKRTQRFAFVALAVVGGGFFVVGAVMAIVAVL